MHAATKKHFMRDLPQNLGRDASINCLTHCLIVILKEFAAVSCTHQLAGNILVSFSWLSLVISGVMTELYWIHQLEVCGGVRFGWKHHVEPGCG